MRPSSAVLWSHKLFPELVSVAINTFYPGLKLYLCHGAPQDLSSSELPLEQLLSNPAVMASVGVAMTAETGETVFNFPAVFALLRERLDAYTARTGGGGGGAAGGVVGDAAADAARAALRYVQRYNAHALLAGAQAAALEAWQQLVQVGLQYMTGRSHCELGARCHDTPMTFKGWERCLLHPHGNSRHAGPGFAALVHAPWRSRSSSHGSTSCSTGCFAAPPPRRCTTRLRHRWTRWAACCPRGERARAAARRAARTARRGRCAPRHACCCPSCRWERRRVKVVCALVYLGVTALEVGWLC